MVKAMRHPSDANSSARRQTRAKREWGVNAAPQARAIQNRKSRIQAAVMSGLSHHSEPDGRRVNAVTRIAR